MDEISAHAKADPVVYRLQHLKETRIIDVVKAAAKTANWDTRPSPKRDTARTGTRHRTRYRLRRVRGRQRVRCARRRSGSESGERASAGQAVCRRSRLWTDFQP